MMYERIAGFCHVKTHVNFISIVKEFRRQRKAGLKETVDLPEFKELKEKFREVRYITPREIEVKDPEDYFKFISEVESILSKIDRKYGTSLRNIFILQITV